MSVFQIESTKNSPFVAYDKEANNFCIKGISTMSDAKLFYQPIVDWINNFENKSSNEFTFDFYLPYFNSSSNKCIYYLIEAIANKIQNGKQFQVCWWVEDDDEFMKESGEAIEEMLGLKFRYKQIPFNEQKLF